MEPVVPPPIRRILVDDEPTIVAPPPHAPVDGNRRRGRRSRSTLTSSAGASSAPSGQHVERMRTESLSIAYGGKVAVDSVDLPVRQGEVLALIGPSGCGKTTLLRSLNRLVELTPSATRSGRITIDGAGRGHASRSRSCGAA